MSAIEKYVPEDSEIDRIQRIATNFANSGYFSDAKEALQAFVKISAGAEMGLQPFVSMSGIAIIQGKPVVGAGILAGLLDDHPDFDYTVTWEPNPATPTACTVTVFKNGTERGASRFSMDDATAAGLAGKDVWKKFQRNMLYARAMSNAVAWYAPSVTRSNGRVFVEGEIEDDEPVRARPIATPRTAPAPAPRPDMDETVVEAEVIEAPVVGAAAEGAVDPREPESASITVPTLDLDQIAPMLKAMSAAQRKAVRESCEHLSIAWDGKLPQTLYERFGDAALAAETLIPALAAALDVPAIGEAEGDAPLLPGDAPLTDEEREQAAGFQAWVDEQDARRAEAGEQMAGSR